MNNNNNNNKKNLNTIDSIKSYIQMVIENNGFGSKIMENIQINQFTNGLVEAELTISKELTNSKGFAHGGLVATLLDSFSSMAYISTRSDYNFGVTVNINVSYINVAEIGSRIKVISKIKKITNSFIFAKSKIIKSDGSLVAMANVIFKVPISKL